MLVVEFLFIPRFALSTNNDDDDVLDVLLIGDAPDMPLDLTCFRSGSCQLLLTIQHIPER
jgi:hypothetical protein